MYVNMDILGCHRGKNLRNVKYTKDDKVVQRNSRFQQPKIHDVIVNKWIEYFLFNINISMT